MITPPAPDEVADGDPAVKELAREESTEAVAARTRELLDGLGWCLWQCSALDGAVIVVARDETVRGYPTGLPVYTEAELREETMMGKETIRLCYEVKKRAGCTITRVEDSPAKARLL